MVVIPSGLEVAKVDKEYHRKNDRTLHQRWRWARPRPHELVLGMAGRMQHSTTRRNTARHVATESHKPALGTAGMTGGRAAERDKLLRR